MKKHHVTPKKNKEETNAIQEKRKKQEPEREVLREPEEQEQVAETPEPKKPLDPRTMRETPAPSRTAKIAESRTVLEQPLAPGQKLFETPEGEILVGEAERDHMWSRNMNGGKGGWANPKR